MAHKQWIFIPVRQAVIDLNRIVNKDGSYYHCILNQIIQMNLIFKKFDMKCKVIVRQKHTTGVIFLQVL